MVILVLWSSKFSDTKSNRLLPKVVSEVVLKNSLISFEIKWWQEVKKKKEPVCTKFD